MKDLEINIQELAFLTGLDNSKASELFKDTCWYLSIDYKSKMRLSIANLEKRSYTVGRSNLVDKALDIHNHYFKRYESRFKLLNNKACIEKQSWVGGNAAVKVFLKPEDVATIENIWRQKKQQFYSQQGLFGVTPVLVAPRKSVQSKSQVKVAHPN